MFDTQYKHTISELKEENKGLRDSVRAYKDTSNSNKKQAEDLGQRLRKLKQKATKLKCSRDELKLDNNIKVNLNHCGYVIPLEDYSKYYVIFNGLAPDTYHKCKQRPTFWVNDTNNFHTGFIHYDHDLIRKLFTKGDLDHFFKVFSLKNANLPIGYIHQLHQNVMTLAQAKDKHLILASDYNKSYVKAMLQKVVEERKTINDRACLDQRLEESCCHVPLFD